MGGPDDPSFESFLSPRVVTLSPFYLDRTEVTVRAYRETMSADPRATAWSGSLAGTSPADFCTFTREPGRFDDHPVNCIKWADARAYCMRRGGDLPTEAQREYVASALIGRPYVWGFDPPACGDAVVAVGPQSERFTRTVGGFDTACRRRVPPSDPELDAIGYPRAVGGPHGRDVLELPGGAVHDLAGNMTEWMRDDWQARGGACWTSPEIVHDPVCLFDDAAPRTIRGASWTSPLATADAWLRQPFPADPDSAGIAIGIRCAYPAR
jgi:formylglycine-generating enzyme required for sulfatase activity